MKLIDKGDYQLIGPALFIPKSKTLVLGDLHIGTDEDLAASGALSPLIGLSDIEEITALLVQKTNPKTVVLLGDLEVHFGAIPYKQKRAILDFVDKVKGSSEKVILIKGNHDNFISKIFEGSETPMHETYEQDGFFFCHGDSVPEIPKDAKYVVIGHEHPAITITNDVRRERFKCIIQTDFEKKELIVLPSVNQTTMGTDILSEKLQSPFLTDKAMKKANIYVVENLDIYSFGKIKNVQQK